MALHRRCPQDGLLHHSDRGVQYASQALRDLLKREGLTMSIVPQRGSVGQRHDESFFGSLKTEWIDTDYATEAQARMEVFKYIEMFYNSDPTPQCVGLSQSGPIRNDGMKQDKRIPMTQAAGVSVPAPTVRRAGQSFSLMSPRKTPVSIEFCIVYTIFSVSNPANLAHSLGGLVRNRISPDQTVPAISEKDSCSSLLRIGPLCPSYSS